METRLFPAALADRTAYAAMLRVLLALHEPREAQLRRTPGLPALGIDLAGRRKSPRLRADLTALGTAPAPESSAGSESAGSESAGSESGGSGAADDLPAALGTFYVLEGSTLGGRVLLREVRDQLGAVPTAFLHGYGEETGRMWKQTRTALVAGVGAAADPDRAADRLVAGATATFDALDRLLTASGWASA